MRICNKYNFESFQVVTGFTATDAIIINKTTCLFVLLFYMASLKFVTNILSQWFIKIVYYISYNIISFFLKWQWKCKKTNLNISYLWLNIAKNLCSVQQENRVSLTFAYTPFNNVNYEILFWINYESRNVIFSCRKQSGI